MQDFFPGQKASNQRMKCPSQGVGNEPLWGSFKGKFMGDVFFLGVIPMSNSLLRTSKKSQQSLLKMEPRPKLLNRTVPLTVCFSGLFEWGGVGALGRSLGAWGKVGVLWTAHFLLAYTGILLIFPCWS